jgi:hypothetical protein
MELQRPYELPVVVMFEAHLWDRFQLEHNAHIGVSFRDEQVMN